MKMTETLNKAFNAVAKQICAYIQHHGWSKLAEITPSEEIKRIVNAAIILQITKLWPEPFHFGAR